MSQESYTRAARLVYIARYPFDGAKAALVQAHRRAAAAVAAHPDDDDAAVREALRSVLDGYGSWASSRFLRGPRLVPVDVTAEQRKVLDQMKAYDYRVAVAAIYHLLEGAAMDDLGGLVSPEQPDLYEGRVREAVVGLCRDRETGEIRALLLGRELDPVVVPVSARAVLRRRRRRTRVGGAVTAVIVALAAAGVWWFGIRIPPLGSYANDPRVWSASQVVGGDYGIDAWPARGELLGDTALLRRAADGWRARGLPSGTQPHVIFAGRVQDVTVVAMVVDQMPSDASSLAVYAEGLRDKQLGEPHFGDTRVMVNPLPPDPAGPGAIRLLDSRVFQTDPILLPPGASDVETGPLDTPSTGWLPAHPDARGVLEVPLPQQTAQQRVSEPSDWSPSAGIRFKESDHSAVDIPSVTVPDTLYSPAPLLPVLGSDYMDHQDLSNADWCAFREQAELNGDLDDIGYLSEYASDMASGPLPDGGGTGYVISRGGVGPQWGPFSDAALLAESGASCATATLWPGQDMANYARSEASSPTRTFVTQATAAMVWISPAKRPYLVVAAKPGVAKLRVSGPATASADGRWLVAPLPYVTQQDEPAEQPLVEAYDAAGHRCGDPDPAKAGAQYCYSP
ncbi:hypothetical protein KGQ20_25295 [Catenulispora sp. NF23]|uniref:DNA-directed RNA polymerase specialized sigma24 family protein n=1 Tax=Catenulispora pinistramenti TaxID=2705254 RepID=A0ABS5KW82_9ACTN|nr:hypothetical protein [Catenulispora pinistramenti]MBS2536083.1 hypothetical protein [Catenulispora pinistramenti]MBS2550317.1 hypothetical protein [Catenulispora pinistramenti]